MKSIRITYQGEKSKKAWVNELDKIIKDSEKRGWVTSLSREGVDEDAPTVDEYAPPDFLAFCKTGLWGEISTLPMTFDEESEKY